MSISKRIISVFDKIVGFPTAKAHCDIPCGIYDPYIAQYAAYTVLRMTNLITGLEKDDPEYDHKLSRYTATKDEFAEKTKHEIRILWGDYFKEEHEKDYPEITKLVWKAMKLGSQARQHIDEKAANELVETVLRIAEIFWATKGVSTKRITAPYPTGGELVIPA